MNFALTPSPHSEAAALIANKPLLVRETFDSLPDDLKSRAFTITGVEDFDVMQTVRDRIATLPAGADWKAVRKEIAAQVSPWFTPEGATARAELLMRHHTFSAYSACQAKIMDEQADIFTHRQYLSTGDGKVRASHAALDGIILRADDPFWHSHTPPWEWNCRCQVVELLEDEAQSERAKDKQRNPENRRVLEGPALQALHDGRISRGPDVNHQLGTPLSPVRNLAIPYEEIAKRWDAPVREAFEAKAATIPMEGDKSLLDSLTAKSGSAAGARQLRGERPATFAAAAAKLMEKPVWSRADLANLRASLRVADPVQASAKILSVTGARATGVLTEKEITRTVQDLLDILPPRIAESLPQFHIGMVHHILQKDGSIARGVLGEYIPASDGRPAGINIATSHLEGLKGLRRLAEMRRRILHELGHWLHLDASHPRATDWRQALASHFQTRTAADRVEVAGDVHFKRDRWWHWYAGKIAGPDDALPVGLELASRHLELWEDPVHAAIAAGPANAHAAAFRETFALVNSILDTINP